MKTAKDYHTVRRVRYYSESMICAQCGSRLHVCHAVWRKYLTFLTETLHVTNVGCRCPNPACPQAAMIQRSVVADSLSLRGFSFSLEVIVSIGQWRWSQQRSRQEIHAILHERGVAISEREVQHLYETYALLLGVSAPTQIAAHREQMLANGGIVVALDGIQPKKGHECLWVVRDALTNTTLAAANLAVSDAAALRALLLPLTQRGIPIRGVISDGFKPIRLVVAELWPGIPHQICQYHILRDIAQPTVEADRALKTTLKQELRGIRAVEQRLQRDPDDPAAPTLTGYTQALRALLLEDGRPPLDLPGVRIYEGLERIVTSLERCRGMTN